MSRKRSKTGKTKGPIGKLKDKIEDADEQLAVLSTLVRLGILIWSGGILTLNYVTIWITPAEDRSDIYRPVCLLKMLANVQRQTVQKI